MQLLKPVFLLGYGFVDFESPFAAQRAVAALQSKGIQAQMARVCHFLAFQLFTLLQILLAWGMSPNGLICKNDLKMKKDLLDI